MKHLTLSILLASSIFLGNTTHAQQATSTPTLANNSLIGRYLPENLQIKYLLDEPKILPVPVLLGKVTVLLFWASWNEASVKELFRINELAQTHSKMVNIYAVTNERERTARAFLKNNKLDNLKIVIDDELSTLSKIFEHTQLPHAVIINPSLRIDAITHPKNIVDATIELSYYEQPSDLLEKKDPPLDLNFIINDLKKDNNQVTHIDLQPFNPKYLIRCMVPGTDNMLNRRITYVNIGLKNIYQDLYKYTEARTIVEATDPSLYIAEDRDHDRHYCFDVVVPPGAERQLYDIAIKYLNHVTNLKSSVQRRKVRVFLIKKNEKRKLQFVPSNQAPQPLVENGNKLESRAINMNDFAFYLEKVGNLPFPVIDATNLIGNYKCTLEFKTDDSKPLDNALERAGLKFEISERELDVLVLKEVKHE